MLKSINRRAAIAGALALPVAPALATYPGNLAAISIELDAAIAADRQAWLAASDADAAADADEKALRPLALRIRPEDAALGICGINDHREAYAETDVIFLREHFRREGVSKVVHLPDNGFRIERLDPSVEGIARAREIVKAWAAWQAAIRASGKRAEERQATERAKGTSDAVEALLDCLAAMRASSSSDVAVKVSAMAWALGVDPVEVAGEVATYDRIAGPILASIISDAEQLAR